MAKPNSSAVSFDTYVAVINRETVLNDGPDMRGLVAQPE